MRIRNQPGTVDGDVNEHVNEEVNAEVNGEVNGQINEDINGGVTEVVNEDISGRVNGRVNDDFNENVNGAVDEDVDISVNEDIGSGDSRSVIVTCEDLVANRDRAVRDALDEFCRSSEQTYEQFVNTFSQLTPADIAAHATRMARRPAAATPPGDHCQTTGLHDELAGDENPSTGADSADSCPADELEEEVLPVGTRVRDILLRDSKQAGGCTLKVDNFLDDDEDVCEDESSEVLATEESCLYTASCLDRQLARQPLTSADSDVDSEVSTDHLEELRYETRYDIPNPGEVDDDLDGSRDAVKVNIRCLDCSARMISTTPADSEVVDSGDVAEETDVVEAFELDPNFDYDNVVLTPKYTADEILQISRSRDNPVQLTLTAGGSVCE